MTSATTLTRKARAYKHIINMTNGLTSTSAAEEATWFAFTKLLAEAITTATVSPLIVATQVAICTNKTEAPRVRSTA